jgi:hypothetical protein
VWTEQRAKTYLFNRLRHLEIAFVVLRLYKIAPPVIQSEIIWIIALVFSLELEVAIYRSE